MAEGEGFEPSRDLHPWQFSRLLPSTARSPFRERNKKRLIPDFSIRAEGERTSGRGFVGIRGRTVLKGRLTGRGTRVITYAVNRAMRRARISIVGSLIAAIALMALQAPVVLHEASHWAERRAAAASAPSLEHRHGEELHLHRHAAEHDHEVRLQEVPLAVAPARFLYQAHRHPFPISGLTAVPMPLFADRVPDRFWSVRGPPSPLALSFPPAHSTAPPAA